ncbi:hypothetical protein [Flavobacterium sp.]|jgi:hypothetical protein|uniref:hypothetical protein n=1 Tax=Flavobacterium sp. TaxID=239 RepID=UPI002A812897|nr:hypothetical protein [Flavobacterium sp.]
MKYLLFILLSITLSFAQDKNCIYDYEEETDSIFVKVLPEKLIYERVYGNIKEMIHFVLINNNGVPTLNLQYIQTSKDFITASCLDKTSRIVFQLANGKIVTLISNNEEVCNNLIYNKEDKNNIRILDGYFLFTKNNYEELKKSPVHLMRIQFTNGAKDFVIKKEIQSELLNTTYYPEKIFIDFLNCLE